MKDQEPDLSFQENKVLEFIYRWIRPIRAGDLSKEMDIKHTTLNSQLKLLELKGLVRWDRYGPIELTEKGIEAAKHLNRHHGILENFMIEVLGMKKSEAQLETLSLAPVVSCGFVNLIGNKFNLPSTCACGTTIPTEGEFSS